LVSTHIEHMRLRPISPEC